MTSNLRHVVVGVQPSRHVWLAVAEGSRQPVRQREAEGEVVLPRLGGLAGEGVDGDAHLREGRGKEWSED